MVKNIAPITWKGEYTFRLNGSGFHEDTLRIKSTHRKEEEMLKLFLPTLCITYADVKFQDSIGGSQENFPASQAYGPVYFDPPIEILGEEDIEEYTYIRGAHRVEIGPDRTTIEFSSWKGLVIPRLRLDQKEAVEAALHVPDTHISVDEPLQITALQYADGRHIGGVRLEKRHPDWSPPERKEVYSLWIRVIDGISLQTLPEVMVDILHWDPKASTPLGTGGFRHADRIHTDGHGCIQVSERPSGELEAYVVRHPDSRAVVRCLRPLAGQNVRLHMRVWPMKRDTMRIAWPRGGKLDLVARRTGVTVTDIVNLNRLRDSSVLKAGTRITLPCYVATYYMEPWDTLDWVGQTFGYRDASGLAEANGLKNVKDLDGGAGIRLPDWRFYYAQENDTLDEFDAIFGLPEGSSITVGRVFHPDPRLPYAGETVAVPTPLFAERLNNE
jgi:hypothetical protein